MLVHPAARMSREPAGPNYVPPGFRPVLSGMCGRYRKTPQKRRPEGSLPRESRSLSSIGRKPDATVGRAGRPGLHKTGREAGPTGSVTSPSRNYVPPGFCPVLSGMCDPYQTTPQRRRPEGSLPRESRSLSSIGRKTDATVGRAGRPGLHKTGRKAGPTSSSPDATRPADLHGRLSRSASAPAATCARRLPAPARPAVDPPAEVQRRNRDGQDGCQVLH
jgi:hypothetical protein